MVAQLLWKESGISRVEISRKLDLYRSTVSNIINSLIDHGIVLEGEEGAAMAQGGRKPIYLALNEKFGCVVGMELQPNGYHAVILNVFGSVLYSCEGLLPEGSFEMIIDYILELLHPHILDTSIPLLGICVGMPGVIDSGNGVIVLSDPFQLTVFDFSKKLSAKYSIPFIVENDANCLAWMELANNRGVDLKSFICLNAEYQLKDSRFGEPAGMSLGIGVAIGGSVYSGSKYAAGEFVSLSWRGDKAGQTGLDDVILNTLESDPQSFAQWTVDLFESLLPVISVLDPAKVFLHGELARHSDIVKEIVASRVPQFNILLKRSLCAVEFGDGSNYSVAIGAALMYFLYLFMIPGGSTGAIGSAIDWDTVFELSERR